MSMNRLPELKPTAYDALLAASLLSGALTGFISGALLRSAEHAHILREW